MAISNLFGGLITQIGGGLQAAAGFESSAASARAAGHSAMQVAQHNARLEAVNLKVRLDVLSRQIGRVASTQRASTGASGLAIGSKSFMAVMDSTLAQFERQIIRERNASKQRQQSLLYEGTVAKVEAENRARAFEFRASQARFGAISSAFSSLLGG